MADQRAEVPKRAGGRPLAPLYRTGFVALPDNGNEPLGPFHGAGWTAELVPNHPKIVGGSEIVIRAGSWASAQRAADLINASRVLVNGDPDVLGSIHPLAHNEGEPVWMNDAERAAIPDPLVSQSWLPTACAVAAKASRRRPWTYAVTNYQFSMELFSVHHMDMHPSYPNRFGVSGHPADHVMFSHAILSAFLAIEHLGLGVPAGPGKPSRIGGVWNPVVLEDLQGRLRHAGIDPAESILWTVRGPARRIERKRALPVGASPSWAGGPVRDRSVPLPDAIAYSDFLRDRVAAHGERNLVRSLSPHDVVNVQGLARYLLLSTMGHRVWEVPHRRRT